MRGTSERLLVALAALMVFVFGGAAPIQAHPMPDTEIVIVRGEQTLDLVIRLPMADLMLALPPRVSRDVRQLLSRDQPDLRAYFAAHTRLRSLHGATVPVAIRSIRQARARDQHAGSYSELEVLASARIGRNVPLSLFYDGVLHRIANHRALVRDGVGRPIGIISYSLKAKAATPLILPAARSTIRP